MKHETRNMEHKKNGKPDCCFMFHASCFIKERKGFTLLELVIYIAVLSLVLLLASSFVFYFAKSNYQSAGDREVLDNARRVLEIMAYEVSGATGVYTPTTSATQLSLETSRYVPKGESTTYLDFFICQTRICEKKDSQNPIYLASDSVSVTSLVFNRISINGATSIKMTVTLRYKNTFNGSQPSVTLTSTAALRSY